MKNLAVIILGTLLATPAMAGRSSVRASGKVKVQATQGGKGLRRVRTPPKRTRPPRTRPPRRVRPVRSHVGVRVYHPAPVYYGAGYYERQSYYGAPSPAPAPAVHVPQEKLPSVGIGLTGGALGYEDALRSSEVGLIGRFRLSQTGHFWLEAEASKSQVEGVASGGEVVDCNCNIALRRIGVSGIYDILPRSKFSIYGALGGGYADGLNGYGESYAEIGIGLVGRFDLNGVRLDAILDARTGAVSETFEDDYYYEESEAIGYSRLRAGLIMHF